MSESRTPTMPPRVLLHKNAVLKAAALLILLVFFFCSGFASTSKTWQASTPVNEPSASETAFLTMEPGLVYCQTLRPLGRSMQGFRVAIGAVDAVSNGYLTISVRDSKDTVLWSAQAYEVDLRSGAVFEQADGLTFVDCFFDLQDLPRFSSLKIEIALEGTDSSTTQLALFSKTYKEKAGNLKRLTVNGARQVGSLYLSYQVWTYLTLYPPVWAALCLLCILLVCLPLPRRLQHFLQVLYLLVPPFVFFCFEFVSESLSTLYPWAAGINLLLVYLVYGLLWALAGGRFAALALLLCGNLLSLANYFVSTFRGSPLNVNDIAAASTAASVAGNYQFILPGRYIIALYTAFAVALCLRQSGTPVLTLLLARLPRVPRFKHLHPLRHPVVLRLLCGMVCILAFAATIASLPLYGFSSWSLSSTFSTLGWLYTNCMIVRVSRLAPPLGYSEEKCRSLLESASISADENAVRPTNLIVIMNESFTDFSAIAKGSFEPSQDPLPFFHSLADDPRAQTGLLTVPVHGGGTCDTEWEVLTGNNKDLPPIENTPYLEFYSSSRQKYNTDSLAGSLRELGYKTAAMHPYNRSNWNRELVYELMGFEDYLAEESYPDAQTLRGFITDASDYARLIEYTEAQNGAPCFVFNVTVQNHGSYNYFYDVPHTITLPGLEAQDAEVFLSLLYESDQALKDLLAYYETVEEPTMIVFFGDHHPALSKEFRLTTFTYYDHPETEESNLQYITPYLIWTNYDRTDSVPAVPSMSASYLGSYIKQIAGLPLSDYDKYMLESMQQYPVIAPSGVYAADGTFTSFDLMFGEVRKTIDEMRGVQYYHMTH